MLRMKKRLVSIFPFSMQAMQRNPILILPSQQWLHKLHFLQKLVSQKPCLDKASNLCSTGSIREAFGLGLVRKVNKLDREGISLLFLRVFFESFPDELTYLLNATLGSTTTMSSLTVHGKIFGKSCSSPRANETRAIMPQSSFLTLFDIGVAAKLIQYLGSYFPVVPSTHVAGLP